MKSPFPGMDPYLEARWGDVHTRPIVYACDQLRRQMPGGLLVRAQEHVTVQVTGSGNGHSGSALETETQRAIHIIDTRSGNRVVTALAFLSPTNKSDVAGRAAYEQKQQELRAAKVNLVEIDLLRAGPYVLSAAAHGVPLTYLFPYRICIFRASQPRQCEMYRVSLRERLPVIRIPLRETDADARLDIQELIDKAYENGGYDAEIDYRVDPFPALQGADADWADALLRQQGQR